nr:pseudouridine-5'-phosphatase-like [Biomphalaria glabrata]
MTQSELKMTHVVFDVDGLILDTERVYTECLEEICGESGHQYTWEIKARQMGMKEHESAKLCIDELNLPLTVEEYLNKLRTKLAQKLPSAQVLPGAEKLIRHLHSHNIPIAVATGADNWGFEKRVSGHKELFSLFSHSVLSSSDPEVKYGKPAPDCFLVCAARFKDTPDPQQVLVFEDAPNGAEAGLAAGMRVVWVPDPRADRSKLGGKVDLVLESLELFKPECFGLPPYPNS